MHTKQVAVVGAGYWGKNLVRNFHELGALGHICDADTQLLAGFRKQYPEVATGSDFQQLLGDQGIRALAIATPAVTYYELATLALLAGKDVFVEKPLALDSAQGARLVQLAEQEGRILMVGHILHYHPAVIKLQELVAAGALGKILHLYSQRLNLGKIRTEENVLWSFAPHDISVILALLNMKPEKVACRGGAYLQTGTPDMIMGQLTFAGGISAHIFASWLHPFKEQRLVVVGSQQMAVFDDTATHKLLLYPHTITWKNGRPLATKAEPTPVELEAKEPLKEECRHFLACLATRATPKTSGAEGLRVLEVLNACQRSLEENGRALSLNSTQPAAAAFFVHPSACVDEGASIGPGTKIWHFSHIMPGAKIGAKCVLGQNVNVDANAILGNNVKVQNNVSIYTGTVVEDDVFLGPSCVLTNVTNPRSQVNRHSLYEKTLLKRGCTIGANATIVCGVTIGKYAFVAAGTVVTKDVPDYALLMGNPGRIQGWMSRHGHRLTVKDAAGNWVCPESRFRYREDQSGRLKCLDLDEDAPLPATLAAGTRSYDDFKKDPA
ncbi:MAG: Gfo/Idh/MocA family oxidoreductase [Lentisphaerae bacterium]|nr:Gfo/Idh/MocA family oxidoreductase [Lentisphaerota bacterium]